MEPLFTAASRTSTRSLQRHRGGGIRIHLNARGNDGTGAGGVGGGATAANTPAILQNLFGSRSELVSQGLRRGGPLLVDFGFAILDQLGIDNDLGDLDGGNSVLGGAGGVRAALSSIPSALIRWNEESRVIDGESVHDCVTALKPSILEVVEKVRAEELAERRARKKKLEEEAAKKAQEEAEKKRKAEEEQATAAAAAAALNAPKIEVSDSDNAAGTSEAENITPSTVTETTTAAGGSTSASVETMPENTQASTTVMADGGVVVVTQGSSSTHMVVTTQPENTEGTDSSNDAAPAASTAGTASASNQLPAAVAPLSPVPEDSQLRRIHDEDANMESLVPDASSTPTTRRPEGEVAMEEEEHTAMEVASSVLREDLVASGSDVAATTAAMQAQPAAEEPRPGTSGVTQNASDGPNYSEILGIDVSELPEDVDPSFLAALPEEMRQEIIDDQRRRRRAAQQQTQAAAASATQGELTEVSPEFLAALPPNLQEEVLAQQRMEAQRRAAVTANPEAPVDPGEFLSNLPASLRQSVLADLEDSQMAALPAEMAAEAATLRREYDLRNHRAMINDRIFSQAGGGSATLSSILRNAHRLSGSYHVIGGLGNGARDGWTRLRPGMGNPASLLTSTNMKFKGRQLLDNEGLSCLLILLFIDDPKINTTRLHRILKYLCYHAPTRDWIVHSLLSILDKSNDRGVEQGSSGIQQQQSSASAPGGFDTPPAKIRKSTSKSSALAEARESTGKSNNGSQQQNNPWLNISMDAALGFRANVFQVNRTMVGKKSSTSSEKVANSINIHPGASAVVCRHTLEVLISLAKSFPGYFLPWKEHEQHSKPKDKEDSAAKPKGSKNDSSKKSDSASSADFWDTLLKLDSQSGSQSKKGKSVVRSHSSVSSFKSGDEDDEKKGNGSFVSSIFGQLLSMLSSPVIRRNSVLTDKLLRLLSIISVGQPDFNKRPAEVEGEGKKEQQQPTAISPDHLKLAVEVLTSKACSEEGLEDVNALLLNLSYGPEPTRDTILRLLLEGAQQLGSVVRQNVLDLQMELRKLKTKSGEESSSSTDAQKQNTSKGLLMDRFTSDQVVLTAPTKIKGGPELQLPSMNALTSKTSSQAFFLRVLKVIIQLREAALLAMKKPAKTKPAQDSAVPPVQDNQSASTSPPGEAETSQDQQMEIDNTDPSAAQNPASKKEEKTEGAEEQECLQSLSEQLQLEQLWETLSSCLKDLADTPDHHAVLVLQATVEAFFLVHAAITQPDDKKKVQLKETRGEQLAHIQDQLDAPYQPSGPTSLNAPTPSTSNASNVSLSMDTEKFLSFAETHRTVLNQILRQSTAHLADGPFSVLVDHTRVLDFDIKRRYFRTELERLDEGMRREDLAVHVKRDNVFEDSFRELHRRSPEEWKNRFYIVFEGEEGQDAGGLLREWYVIISREIFNPMYALFKNSPGDRVTYMIQEHSHTNPNHLDYFKFVGRVIAKAIYDNKLLECYFTRSFYKHILAKHVKYQDMESEDYAFFKGLEFLLTNDVADLGYDLTFSLEVREFGVTEVRDLIKDGRNIKVTEANKHEYVHRVCQMKMTGDVRKQLAAFLEGFYNIIPRRLISIFNEQELELLLSGLPTIDVDDLKANTEYHKYQANSLQIVWFWRALRSFDQTDKAKFMQFVTGSSKVPLQGFAALEGMNGPQKFQIHRDDRSTDRLPSAHTCFNQLDLPAYETYDKLRTYLLKAVQECSEGFGFA